MLLDHPLIAQRYFVPRPDRVATPLRIDCGDAELCCYRASPHPEAPTVLHFHGNGEVVADYLPQVEGVFTEMGCNVIFAEYRGYGGSSGTPLLGKMLSDVDAIVAAIEVPVSELVVFGRSVGSMFAIDLASRHSQLRGLILESGIADPFERVRLRIMPAELGVSEAEMQAAFDDRLDHRAKLGSYSSPLLVLHAEHDGLVDVSHAKRNFAWAAGSDKQLELFPRGDHNSIMGVNWDAYWASVRSFIFK